MFQNSFPPSLSTNQLRTTATMIFIVGRVEVYLLLVQIMAMQAVAATTVPPPTPAPTGPPPPTSLQISYDTNRLAVFWTASISAAAYRVTYQPAGGSETDSVSSTAATSHTILGLSSGTLYTVRVYGISSNGVEGDPLEANQGTSPLPPTNLQFANVGTTSLDVSWTASSSAATYRVTYQTDGGSGTNSVASTVSIPHTITGLSAGTLYTVRVYGIANGVESDPLQAIQRTVPNAPQNFQSTGTTTTTIDLSWDVPDSANGATFAKYRITYTPSGGSSQTLEVTDLTATSTSLTGLSPGVQYTISLVAVSADDSIVSAEAAGGPLTVRTNAAQSGDITVAHNDLTENSIKITWTPAGASVDSYSVSIYPDTGVTNPTGSVAAADPLQYTFTGLTAGVLYTMSVTAVRGGVSSLARTKQQRTTVAQPGVINIALGDVTEKSIRITWAAAAGVKDSYDISISPDTDVTNPFGSVAATDTLEYTFTGLTAGALYTISVITGSGGVNSVARTKQQRTTVAQPGVINIALGDVTEKSIRITWAAAAGVKDSYDISISPDTDVTNPFGSVAATDTLEYTFTGLTAGALYTISVITGSGGVNSVARTKQQRTTVAQPGVINIALGDVTENNIRITWAAAAGVKDSYDIGIFPDTDVTNPTGTVNDGDTLEYMFTSLTPGVLYAVAVVTDSGGMKSDAQTETQRTTVAQPGDIAITSSDVSENSIRITWPAAAGAADSYSISISPADGDNPSGSVIASATLEYTFTGLTAGTEYIIIAITVSGVDNSVARTTTQRTTVAQPGNISITPTDVSATSIKITWTAAAGGKDSYIIIISPDSGVTNPTGNVNDGDTLEYTFTGLTAGTLYTINVITVSGGVNSAARTEQQRTTVGQPGVINIAPSEVTENSIRITWTAAPGTKDSYSIDISPTGSVNDGETLEYSFDSLTAGTLYTISVTAISGGVTSEARIKERRTNLATPSGNTDTSSSTVTGSLFLSTSSPDGNPSASSISCSGDPGVYAGVGIGTAVVGAVIGVLATLLVQHLRAKRTSAEETGAYEDVVARKTPARQSASAYGEYDIPMETVPPRPDSESTYQELTPAVYESLRKN
ncbi:fibronectin-like [Branchiostoma lanceolatum]|uniref:fibronectin-like n=1 Tax=Branchiostoma lanceolatum TaxID=7740 RepID=UPI003456A648